MAHVEAAPRLRGRDLTVMQESKMIRAFLAPSAPKVQLNRSRAMLSRRTREIGTGADYCLRALGNSTFNPSPQLNRKRKIWLRKACGPRRPTGQVSTGYPLRRRSQQAKQQIIQRTRDSRPETA